MHPRQPGERADRRQRGGSWGRSPCGRVWRGKSNCMRSSGARRDKSSDICAASICNNRNKHVNLPSISILHPSRTPSMMARKKKSDAKEDAPKDLPFPPNTSSQSVTSKRALTPNHGPLPSAPSLNISRNKHWKCIIPLLIVPGIFTDEIERRHLQLPWIMAPITGRRAGVSSAE